MGMQARMSQADERLYSPNRDVAHNFEYVIQEVAKKVEEGRWDYLADLAKREGVTDDDLGAVCAALCKFVTVQLDYKRESMAQCLARCGFLELKPAARAAVMATLGTVILGMHWAGVRESTLGGKGPALTYKQLRWHGRKLVLLMKMPRWRRRLYTLWGRVRRAWRVLTERTAYDG